jgi:hypothetical protein
VAISANLIRSEGEVPTQPSSRGLAKPARNNALQLKGFQQEMPGRFWSGFLGIPPSDYFSQNTHFSVTELLETYR